MSRPGDLPQVAVVSAGAVSGCFGGLRARAGAPVMMIGEKPFVEAVNSADLSLDTPRFQEGAIVQDLLVRSAKPGRKQRLKTRVLSNIPFRTK